MIIQDIGFSNGFKLNPVSSSTNIKISSTSLDLFGLNGNQQGAVAGGIPTGVVNANSVINGNLIVSGSISAKSLTIGQQGFVSSVVFSTSAYNVASWTSGTVTLSDGTNYSVQAGTTGEIGDSNARYIYLDPILSDELFVSNNTDAIIGNRILLCIMRPQASTAKGAVLTANNGEGTTISGNSITTGKVQSSDGGTYFDLENGKIVVNDGTNNRVLIGLL